MIFGHNGMKLDIHNRWKFWECGNMWVKEKKIIRKILKSFDMNENKNTPYQNLLDVVKEVFGGKFIAV